VFIKYTFLFSLIPLVILGVTLTQNANISQNPTIKAQSSVEPFPVLSNAPPPADNKSYFDSLLSKGLTKEEAQVLVFHKIKQTYLAKPSKTVYWQASPVGQPTIDTLSQARQIRSAILAEFGEAARDNPVFKEAFFPLEADYLSSVDQIALFEQMAQQQANQAKLLAEGLDPAKLPLSDPTEVLSKQAAYEWKLRKSFLAQQLRASEVTFTEQSFRDSFALLAPIYDFNESLPIPNASDINNAINGLEKLLGVENTIRVQAALDPRFTQFQNLAQKQSLSPDQIITAFGIVLQTENALMQAHDLMAADEDRAVEMMNQATQERDNNLASFIGKETAEQLITTFETPAAEGMEAIFNLNR
jgi:hypothetical protein